MKVTIIINSYTQWTKIGNIFHFLPKHSNFFHNFSESALSAAAGVFPRVHQRPIRTPKAFSAPCRVRQRPIRTPMTFFAPSGVRQRQIRTPVSIKQCLTTRIVSNSKAAGGVLQTRGRKLFSGQVCRKTNFRSAFRPRHCNPEHN